LGSKLSTEGDVYSYGITILEMLTGKRPTDEMFSNGLTLHKFVEKTFPKKIPEILDPSIIPITEDGDNQAVDEITRSIINLINLGISCSVETPKDRPTIKDVYAEVIAIHETFSELCH
jgi:serine/threonine protein kinase